MPHETTEGILNAGKEINGRFESGYLCYGVPVGTDRYVRHMLDLKVEEVGVQAEQIIQVLGEDKQAL